MADLVYLVAVGEYDDFHIKAAFSEPALADEYTRHLREFYRREGSSYFADSVEVVTYYLNPFQAALEQGQAHYAVYLSDERKEVVVMDDNAESRVVDGYAEWAGEVIAANAQEAVSLGETRWIAERPRPKPEPPPIEVEVEEPPVEPEPPSPYEPDSLALF